MNTWMNIPIKKRGKLRMTTDENPIQTVENHPLEAFEMLKQMQNNQHRATFDNDDMVPDGDRVSHPSHYTWLKEKCGVEVIDITRHMDFDLGNSLKYILRAGHKSEEGMTSKEKAVEDLRKAIFYIEDRIKMLENE